MKKLFTLSFLALLAMSLTFPVMAADNVSPGAALYAQNEAALAWLRQAQEPDGGFSSGFAAGSDFGTTTEIVLAAVAGGEDVGTWVTGTGQSPLDYLASQIATGQVTDVGNLSKTLLVAVATGQDPRAFGGRDLVNLVLSSQDATTGWFGDTLFKHAYAVLSLHNAGATVPQNAITAMTSQFTDDGAWALFGGTAPGTADTNTTALVMQALVAVGRADAAAGALPYLHRMQNDDGGFPYQNPSPYGTDSDANSTAVVLQALLALNEPLGNWLSGGTDPLGALLALWDQNSGGYFWQASVPFPNMLATAQAVEAAEGMTLANLPVVGASGSVQATAAQPASSVSPLLPSSGAHVSFGTGVLMAAILVMVGVSALLRRK